MADDLDNEYKSLFGYSPREVARRAVDEMRVRRIRARAKLVQPGDREKELTGLTQREIDRVSSLDSSDSIRARMSRLR